MTPPTQLDARLVFTPPKDGLYRLVVTSFNKPGSTGKFRLMVKQVTATAGGQTLQGELKKNDKTLENRFFHIIDVDLVARRPYVFELDSSRFDSFLMLLDVSGASILAKNHTARELVTGSRIDFTPKDSGSYHLLISTYTPGETGPYTLRIQGYEPLGATGKK